MTMNMSLEPLNGGLRALHMRTAGPTQLAEQTLSSGACWEHWSNDMRPELPCFSWVQQCLLMAFWEA